MTLLDPYFIAALIIAVTIHEFTHAWTATYLGDPTAKYLGRLTLNPLAHLDPVGTIMLFLAGFGWGKPVPFSMNYLKNPRVDAALIAVAGPFSNFVIALILAIPYRFLVLQVLDPTTSSAWVMMVVEFMKIMIELNLILMVFNMLPIPPLDGSKVFSLLLPGDVLSKISRYRNWGYGILIALIFSDYLFGINILGGYILYPLVNFFWDIVLFGA